MECEVESVQCKVWQFEVWSVKCSVKWEVESVECGV